MASTPYRLKLPPETTAPTRWLAGTPSADQHPEQFVPGSDGARDQPTNPVGTKRTSTTYYNAVNQSLLRRHSWARRLSGFAQKSKKALMT